MELQTLTFSSPMKTSAASPYHLVMKKFFRLLLTLGAVAGVVWLLRDKIVPPPQPPVSHPPAFRNQPPPPVVARPESAMAEGDDLTEVKGIGPVYKARLSEMGITTFAALEAADPSAVAEQLEVAGDQVNDWISQARDRT